MGAKAKANTGSSNPSHDDSAEAGHGHRHLHRLLHGNHHNHPRPKAGQQLVGRLESPADDINDCADAFIKRFREQLELQRLQSIENYQQMLARGL